MGHIIGLEFCLKFDCSIVRAVDPDRGTTDYAASLELSMKRSSSSLQHFVANTTTGSTGTSMNFTSRHRGGGRRQWQRDSSYQTNTGRCLVQDVDLRLQDGDEGHSPYQTASQPHTFNARRPFNHGQSFCQPSPHNQGFRPHSVQAQSFQYPSPSSYHPQQDSNQNRRIYRPAPNFQGQQHYQPRQQNPDHLFLHPPRYHQSSPSGPAQQRGLRPPRDLVYRNWEFSRTAVPSDCKRFVVLSYNLLADYLAINHKSKLYFHIPHYMLEWNWRKKSIIFELGLWSADILCLQEVDRFQELEDELKLRGYCGIWKMRTGEPVDGCAIFWRTSSSDRNMFPGGANVISMFAASIRRLRIVIIPNLLQHALSNLVCVEVLDHESPTSIGPVIIRFKLLHEESIEFIELGMRDNVAQLCVLGLINEDKSEDRAHLPHRSSTCVDKVVLCNIHVLYNPKRGDIKLGQIRVLLEKAYTISKAWDNAPVVLCGDFNCTPKSPLYNFISEQQLNLSGLDRDKVSGQASAEIYAPSPNYRNNRNEPYNSSTQAPLKIAISNECRTTSASEESVPTIDISNKTKHGDSLKDERDESCINQQDACEDRVDLTEDNMLIRGNRASVVPNPEDAFPDLSAARAEDELTGGSSYKDKSLDGCLNSEDSPSKVFGSVEPSNSNDDTSENSVDPESVGSFDLSSSIIKNSSGEKDINFDESMDEKMKDLFLNDPVESNWEGGNTSVFEDDSTFVAALHNLEDTNLKLSGRILDETSADPVEERQVTYDPCLWTPEAIAIATGRQDYLDMEHKLKLKSTYTEVEDVCGTRDANGEPLVTSYHRRFMGTVDYIWRSEGLQTVRALAPIPKTAMQWTPGFPTKKWGSDHLALVTELAFVRGESDQEAEVQ